MENFLVVQFIFLGSYNCACSGGYLPDSDNRKKCRKIENYEDSSSHYSSYDSYLASESLSDNSTIVRRYMDRHGFIFSEILKSFKNLTTLT